MNNSFNSATNLQQLNVISHSQHQQLAQQNVTESAAAASNLLQSPPTTTNIGGYLQQTHSLHHNQHHQHPQQQLSQLTQQQYATAMGSTHSAAIFDPRQLQALNALDKTYYAGATTTNVAAVNTAAAAPAAITNGRYYATAANAPVGAASTQPNTILITNNFTQPTAPTQLTLPPQQASEHAQHQRPQTFSGVTTPNNFSNSNLRIVTAAAPNALQQQAHIFNINNNIGKDLMTHPQLTANDLFQLQQQQQQQQQQQLYQQQHQFLHHAHFSQQQQHQLSALLPQHQAQMSSQLQATPHYASQHFTQQQQQPQQQPQHAMQTMQQYYTQATDESNISAIAANAELLPAIVNNTVVAPATVSTIAAAVPPAQPPPPPSVAATTTSSTVVLDRINICINNHYTDAATIASPASVASSISTTPSQQPSPIIPAIQHKAVVDTSNGLLINPYGITDCTSIVIDEPDSTTTTPHTPPTTPENISSSTLNIVASGGTATYMATTNAQSPSCTTTTPKNSFILASPLPELTTLNSPKLLKEMTSPPPPPPAVSVIADVNVQKLQLINDVVVPSTPLTPPTPPTPPQLLPPPSVQMQSPSTSFPIPSTSIPSPPPPLTLPFRRSISPDVPIVSFAIGEDVLIKRNDERFYLGTIIDTAQQKYLVRFDDKSEIWSSAGEMRPLAVSNNDATGQMCVACKRSDSMDIVEICERCGRGYHRNCTDEVTPGCDAWMCKRCSKPMKMIKTSICLDRKLSVCRQLPYDVDSLTWDDKHRVNEEQIYCYCGKSGKFDHNMLQCCRCKNWYHTDCMRCFKNTILRGDGFFVFCCSVCNNGQEFLRRLQMNWVDLIHLTLYNLSGIKKYQNQKYHHLTKDIWPFALEKRHNMPIPKEWTEQSEEEFKENIKRTLKENSDRFMSGKENKKDYFYYALRHNGPPVLPIINIKPDDILSDDLITEELKLNLLKGAPENESAPIEPIVITDDDTASEISMAKPEVDNEQDVEMLNDIYEFRIEDEDEKFTSDDEIPIKHIMEKAKKQHNQSTNSTTSTTALCHQKYNKTKTLEKMDVDESNDFTSNVSVIPSEQSKQKTPEKLNQKKECINSNNNNNIEINKTITLTADVIPTKNSRKRKAFTLSKSYKETSIDANSKICDSSSDENSSSSRSTSLDLIIPPPKNFLGLNNPFRIVTPKKNSITDGVADTTDEKTVSFGRRGTIIKNSIFTTSLDFSSKLAALKSSGIFSNLSSSDLAKAAGQPRLVRTIKRRLSAKDITIGPNQEVRRRRIRRPSSNVEVISTTTINHIPSNFFPIHAKDLITNQKLISITNQHPQNTHNNNNNINISTSATISSASSSSVDSAPTIKAKSTTAPPAQPTHGRRLRQRPEKLSPNNSRRSSISGASTSSNSSVVSATVTAPATATTILDLKQSVNKYFGAVNRIESGEKFSLRAKRLLANGQKQYLIEWGGDMATA